MPKPSEFEPIFGIARALPRGPHGFTREEVAASQRSRLLAAVADAVAARGFAKTTLADITRRAGVSPRTFYEHFPTKLACFLAAYDAFAAVQFERMASRLSQEDDWDAFVTGALRAYLSSLEQNPRVARAFLLEMESAGPAARSRRHATFATFAHLLGERYEQLRRREPVLGRVPEIVCLGIVHAIRELVRDALDASEQPQLTELVPDLAFWIRATAAGASALEQQP